MKDAENYLREFLALDPKHFMWIWRDFMRVRVLMDVRRSIKHDLIIQCLNCPDICFKYKCLNTFSYFCWIINHGEKNSKLLYDLSRIPSDRYPFGSWLKADIRVMKQSQAKWLQSKCDILKDMRLKNVTNNNVGNIILAGQTFEGIINADKENEIQILDITGIIS